MNKLELKKLIKEELEKALNEVSPDIKEFIGKPLFNTPLNRGKIKAIKEMENDNRYAITVTLAQIEWRQQSGYMPPSDGSVPTLPPTEEVFYYDLGKDEYQGIDKILNSIEDSKGAISKDDASLLREIAKKINSNTKLTSNSVYPKIKG